MALKNGISALFGIRTLGIHLLCGSLALLALDPTAAQAQSLSLPIPTADADFQYDGDPPTALVELGQLLFFDKILSAKDDIACATCHHPFAATSDGVSLGLGHTSEGLGITRVPLTGNRGRIVRNSAGLFNLGWKGITSLLTDGDVSIDPAQPSGFATPAGTAMPSGLHDILATQNMLPTNQPREMAGHDPSNPISAAALAKDNVTAWQLYAEKVGAVPDYVARFQAAFADVSSGTDITFVHIANALSAFQIEAFRADNSPFDRYLRGDPGALSSSQVRGMQLFYGKADCASCHSGIFQSDMGFWAISIPQIGPGRASGVNGRDFGRVRVSRNQADVFRYKTPMLRNVALTAPYGHDGAYATLEAVVRHHLDPVSALNSYDTGQAMLPPNPNPQLDDFAEHNTLTARADRAAANELQAISLSDAEVADLLDFLHALTDPASIDLRQWIPLAVPSGLPVDD
jgi:cytochrome c peroxidase